jgi:hypothetical protein
MFVDDWSEILKRAWSIRVALITGALGGIVSVWSMFADVMPLWAYAALSILFNIGLVVARLMKQPEPGHE